MQTLHSPLSNHIFPKSSCTCFGLVFALLGFICWATDVCTADEVLRLSLRRLLFITVQGVPALGKSNETGNNLPNRQPHPVILLVVVFFLFVCFGLFFFLIFFFLFRSGSPSVFMVLPSGFTRLLFCGSPALVTAISQLRYLLLSLLLTHKQTLLAALQQFGKERAGMRWVICSLARWQDPWFLLKAREIRDTVDVLRCSYHRLEPQMALHPHFLSSLLTKMEHFLPLSPVSGKPLDKRIIFQTHHFLLWIKL